MDTPTVVSTVSLLEMMLVDELAQLTDIAVDALLAAMLDYWDVKTVVMWDTPMVA